MRAGALKKKYPQLWESIYSGMLASGHDAIAAHNAAFLAVSELHKTRARKNAKQRGYWDLENKAEMGAENLWS